MIFSGPNKNGRLEYGTRAGPSGDGGGGCLCFHKDEEQGEMGARGASGQP